MSSIVVKKVAPKSEPSKRKARRAACETDSSSDEADIYFLVEYVDTNEFSVVQKHQVKIDPRDNKKGLVKHKNIYYEVDILKKGKNI